MVAAAELAHRVLEHGRQHGHAVARSPAGAGQVDDQRPAGGPGAGEKPLTGTVAQKVRAAALEKVDGTVLRVETDRGGVYEAHIRKADGTEVEVKVDKAYEVTAVEEFDGDRHGGPHGHGPGGPPDLAAAAKELGVTEARLREALENAR